MRLTRFVKYSALMLVALAAGAWTQAPPKAQTATQFYMEYRAAFTKATKIEDIMKYMSADTRKQIEATPAAERPKMFGMVKMMETNTNIKVTNEALTPTGATLTATAIDDQKKPQKGTITLIKEAGAWKIAKEEWNPASHFVTK